MKYENNTVKPKMLMRVVKHKFLLLAHKLFHNIKYEDAVAEAMAGIAGRWQGEIDPVYSYLAMLDILKQAHISGDGLEIGGYSTILFCQLIDRNGLKIESIDMNPDKYLRIIPRSSVRRFVFERIRRIDRLSVSFVQVQKAYLETLPNKIRDYGDEKFLNALLPFCKVQPKAENYIDVAACIQESLGAQLLGLSLCEIEKQFYIENNLVKGEGYCSELVKRGREFDFVFFDCGEYSSLAEWFLLEEQIKVGGFALLHDIYFPKSVKNFIVAALISLSDKWEIIYVDRISPQGALVARRVSA